MNSDPICNAMEYGSVSSNHVSITFNNRPAILGTPSLVFSNCLTIGYASFDAKRFKSSPSFSR